MICPVCGNNTANEKYCGNCGAEIDNDSTHITSVSRMEKKPLVIALLIMIVVISASIITVLNVRKKVNQSFYVMTTSKQPIIQATSTTVEEKTETTTEMEISTEYTTDDVFAETLYIVNTVSDDLNIREDKSTKSKVVGRIPKGTLITVYEIDDDWAYTDYNGISGYVSTDYIKVYSE